MKYWLIVCVLLSAWSIIPIGRFLEWSQMTHISPNTCLICFHAQDWLNRQAPLKMIPPLSRVTAENNFNIAPTESAAFAPLGGQARGTHNTIGGNMFYQLLRLHYIPFADCRRLSFSLSRFSFLIKLTWKCNNLNLQSLPIKFKVNREPIVRAEIDRPQMRSFSLSAKIPLNDLWVNCLLVYADDVL